MITTILFEPESLINNFNDAPKLRAIVQGAIGKHSHPSTLEGVRKSALPLLHLLAHGNEEFLKRWKIILIKALDKGWRSSDLLQSDRQNFQSFLGELYVAEYLDGIGIKVSRAKQGDIAIFVDGKESRIEVYSPVQMMTRQDFIERLSVVIESIDYPFDFSYTVDIQTIEWWDEGNECFYQLSEMLQEQRLQTWNKSEKLLFEICDRGKSILTGTRADFFEIRDEEVGLVINVTITDINPRQQGLPIRGGVKFTGRSTLLAFTFEQIQNFIQTKIRSKLAQKQSETGLIVYLGEMMDRDQFRRGYNVDHIAGYLRQEFLEHLLPCKFVAFLIPDNSQHSGFNMTHVAYKGQSEGINLRWFAPNAITINVEAEGNFPTA